MKRTNCPECNNIFIDPIGPPDSSILLIGEWPNKDCVIAGRPIAGKVEEILRKEMARIGIQLGSCRITNLWQHGKLSGCDPALHLDRVVKEIPNRSWVVLMGSEITKALTGKGIMEVAGLEIKSKIFPKVKFFAIPNAGTLLSGDIGEMRLALEKFQRKVKKK